MKIILILPPKSKEKYWSEAEKEYEKRLSSYTQLKLVRLEEDRIRGKLSPRDIEKIQEREAVKILSKVPKNSFLVLLDSQGRQLDSPDFASFLEKRKLASTKNLVFVIGGFLGLSQDIKKRADFLLSFSKMTFTHDMMPTLLLEQLYRGFSILAASPYHK